MTYKPTPNPQRQTAKAFTLIELLVVISIISILIAILLPALASARASAQMIQCASNERGVGMGIAYYTDDNKQFYPTSVIYPVPLVWSQVVGTKYLNIDQASAWTIGLRPSSVFACPSSQILITGGNRGDYGLNWHISGDSNQPGANGSLRVDDVINAGEIILTADAVGRGLVYWGAANQSIIGLEGRHKKGLSGTNVNNLVNVLYCDGHVNTRAIKELVVGGNATAFGKRPWKP